MSIDQESIASNYTRKKNLQIKGVRHYLKGGYFLVLGLI
jgi:hypothetical protein